MNRSPTPGGVFRKAFRGWTLSVCGVFVDISWVGVGVLWNVRNGFWVLERVGQLYKVHLELA